MLTSIDFAPTPRLRIVGDPVPVTKELESAGVRAQSARYRVRLLATDGGIILLAMLAAHASRLSALGPTEATRLAGQSWLVLALTIAAWHVALTASGSRDIHVIGAGSAEIGRVVIASAIAFAVTAEAFIVLGLGLDRGTFTLAYPLGIAGLIVGRLLWRLWAIRQARHGRPLCPVVVVGSRVDVDEVLRHLERTSGCAYAVVGVVLTGQEQRASFTRRVPVSADLDRVASFAQSLAALAVVVAGAPESGFVHDLAWQLERTGTTLVLASVPANVAGARLHLRAAPGLSLLHIDIPQFSGARYVLKRALDILVSSVALVVLLPLLVALAILIRADSPGPALFRQERVGREGRRFRMLKFRSMVANATEELDGLLDRNDGAGLLFKMKSDPRITPLGRTLRRHSLDELPQLWNILVGDMSLVGPRPPLPCEVDCYEDHVRRRLYTRPGLTGLWQISGRSTLSWDESVELDLFYVENWSNAGDLLIMARTFRQLSHPVGAF